MKFIQTVEERYVLPLILRGVQLVAFNFCSLNEFLNHEYIRYFTRDKNFKRFTICRDKEYELISELKDGRTFKLGILDGDIKEIPEWCKDNDLKVDGSEKCIGMQ